MLIHGALLGYCIKNRNSIWMLYRHRFKYNNVKNKDIRGVFWNARKSMWKMILSCDSFCLFFSKCPKIKEFHFRFLFYFNIDHVHFFRNAQFSYHIRIALFLKCPIFPIWFWNGKNRAFQKKSKPYMVRKMGISKKMHVINFEREKKSKMKFFDFRAFWKKWQKPSHDKIIFHMLFRAFQNTSRILYIENCYAISHLLLPIYHIAFWLSFQTKKQIQMG